ncbi:hypothetical protein NODU109028_06500 [Nocardioides dubius]|uniref:DUF222 domain-containing protein n=1 Tax=Nocardioides dubius TaxID=317019 RepID=A0ABN1TP84_9ACTN
MSFSTPDLDATAVLHAAGAAVVERRLSEVRELELLAQWAALHGEVDDAGRRRRLAMVRLGGEGTPLVQDHCLGEIALARGTHVIATNHALADALDLQHRLPLIWGTATTGIVDLWIVRKVARLSRHLPLARVGVVDAAIARMLGREGGGRILDVAEAAIIEADVDLHNARVEEEKRRRYVGFGRTNEYGLRALIAQIDAGDAAWIDATLTRVVAILQSRDDVERCRDEWRAVALGYLARPAELLTLLAEEVAEEVAEQPSSDAAADDDEQAPAPCACGLNRAIAFPQELLGHLRAIDWTRLRPKAVLYLHLHEAALTGQAAGVARAEPTGNHGLRAHTLTQLHRLLHRTKVTVKPVIDLNNRVRTTAYEHPEALKERVYLQTCGDYWPYAAATSRNVDYDHVTPYRSTGPPGPHLHDEQTGTHNSGPLGRTHHRWKTHAGYQARQVGEGRYLWTTPHGLAFLVDHTGTRRISPEVAEMIRQAPLGVDVYPGPVSY